MSSGRCPDGSRCEAKKDPKGCFHVLNEKLAQSDVEKTKKCNVDVAWRGLLNYLMIIRELWQPVHCLDVVHIVLGGCGGRGREGGKENLIGGDCKLAGCGVYVVYVESGYKITTGGKQIPILKPR